jgi:shikimate dehydrogenase
LIDDIDEQSEVYGAINTIVNRNGKLTGYNTDAHGFLRALKNEPEFKLEGKRVLILGAGGVARAVSFALIQRKILSLYIMNRTVERAQNLVDSLATYVNENQLPVTVEVLLSNDDARNHVIFDSQLIVNCTTMGMRYSPNEFISPLAKHLIPRGALVYDLVYNPLQTTLLKLAKEAGARTLDGLPMLIYQGAAGFELWTQKIAPIDVMFETAKKQLNR